MILFNISAVASLGKYLGSFVIAAFGAVQIRSVALPDFFHNIAGDFLQVFRYLHIKMTFSMGWNRTEFVCYPLNIFDVIILFMRRTFHLCVLLFLHFS